MKQSEITLNNYFSRPDLIDKGYKAYLCINERGIQSAETNDLQILFHNEIKQLSDTVWGKNKPVAGAEIFTTVENNQTKIIVNKGLVYYDGYYLDVPGATLTINSATPDDFTIVCEITEEIVTSAADDTLKDPGVGGHNFNQPGCERLKITGAWKIKSEADPTKNLVSLIDFKDGAFVILPDSNVAEIDNRIAHFDNQTNGSYVVSGMLTKATGRMDAANKTSELTVGNGIARVMGREVNFTTPHSIDISWPTRTNMDVDYVQYTRYTGNSGISFKSMFYPINKASTNLHAIYPKQGQNTVFTLQYANIVEVLDNGQYICYIPTDLSPSATGLMNEDCIWYIAANGYGTLGTNTKRISYNKAVYNTVGDGENTILTSFEVERGGRQVGDVTLQDFYYIVIRDKRKADLPTWLTQSSQSVEFLYYTDGVTLDANIVQSDLNTVIIPDGIRFTPDSLKTNISGITSYNVPNAWTQTTFMYDYFVDSYDLLCLNSEGKLIQVPGNAANETMIDTPETLLRLAIIQNRYQNIPIAQVDYFKSVQYSEINNLQSEVADLRSLVANLSTLCGVNTSNTELKSTIYINNFDCDIKDEDANRSLDSTFTDNLPQADTIGSVLSLHTEWSTPVEPTYPNDWSDLNYITKTNELVYQQDMSTTDRAINAYGSADERLGDGGLVNAEYTWIEQEVVNTIKEHGQDKYYRRSWWGRLWHHHDYVRGNNYNEAYSRTDYTDSVLNGIYKVPVHTVAIKDAGPFNPNTIVNVVLDGTPIATLTANAQGRINTTGGNTFQTPSWLMSGTHKIELYQDASKTRIVMAYLCKPMRRNVRNYYTYWYDPIAQTFITDDEMFLTQVSLKFSALPSVNDIVRILVCETTGGVPDPNKALTAQDVKSNQLVLWNVSNNAYTNIEFTQPVYLNKDTEYAIVVMTSSLTAKCRVAKIGETDPSTGVRSVKDAASGVLLESSNISTWGPLFNQDLSMRLYRAKFANAREMGALVFTPQDYYTDVMLMANEVAYANTSISHTARWGSQTVIPQLTSDSIYPVTRSISPLTISTKLETTDTRFSPVINKPCNLSFGKTDRQAVYVTVPVEFKHGNHIDCSFVAKQMAGTELSAAYVVEMTKVTATGANFADPTNTIVLTSGTVKIETIEQSYVNVRYTKDVSTYLTDGYYQLRIKLTTNDTTVEKRPEMSQFAVYVY